MNTHNTPVSFSSAIPRSDNKSFPSSRSFQFVPPQELSHDGADPFRHMKRREAKNSPRQGRKDQPCATSSIPKSEGDISRPSPLQSTASSTLPVDSSSVIRESSRLDGHTINSVSIGVPVSPTMGTGKRIPGGASRYKLVPPHQLVRDEPDEPLTPISHSPENGQDQEATGELCTLPMPDRSFLESTPTTNILRMSDSAAANKQYSSRLSVLGATKDAASTNVVGGDPVPPVDSIPSTRQASSPSIVNRNTLLGRLPTRFDTTTEAVGLNNGEVRVVENLASGTQLEQHRDGVGFPAVTSIIESPHLDRKSTWNYEAPLLGYEAVEYRCFKYQMHVGDIPMLTLRGLEAKFDNADVMQHLRLHEFPECILGIRMLPQSETLVNLNNAAPGSIMIGENKPSLTLESGKFLGIRHLYKIVEAFPDVLDLKVRHVLLETRAGLEHGPRRFNHITHLEMFDMQFNSVDIIVYLLRSMPSLTTCSLRMIFIHFKCENGIGRCFTEGDTLKLTDICVHGRDAHSMGKLEKLLFCPVGLNDLEASLFNKSAVENFEIRGPVWDGIEPYGIGRVYNVNLPPLMNRYAPSYLTVDHLDIVSIPTFISFKNLQVIKIIIMLSLSCIDSSAWGVLLSDAPVLEKIELNILWGERNDLWYDRWIPVLKQLDYTLRFSPADWFPALKTMSLQTCNFPSNVNIVRDAFPNVFFDDPSEYNEPDSHYTFHVVYKYDQM
ncbi:hypothetical protein EV421DRAFT_1914749 [Armillaria borealis]|uniref:Uncharacterized protein n=1 Tax=Armillaria borealis TaxID=47425 RepID=A0AA39IE91_9AGAR|nr:hypothetical protein EV421DRAFT_1914749 [Armillaria borealis]